MPEEYDLMVRFVDRVERRIAYRAPVEKAPELVVEVAPTLRDRYCRQKFTIRIFWILACRIMWPTCSREPVMKPRVPCLNKWLSNPMPFLGLQGIGPRSMNQIKALAEKLLAVPEEVVAPVAETVVEVPAEQPVHRC